MGITAVSYFASSPSAQEYLARNSELFFYHRMNQPQNRYDARERAENVVPETAFVHMRTVKEHVGEALPTDASDLVLASGETAAQNLGILELEIASTVVVFCYVSEVLENLLSALALGVVAFLDAPVLSFHTVILLQ